MVSRCRVPLGVWVFLWVWFPVGAPGCPAQETSLKTLYPAGSGCWGGWGVWWGWKTCPYPCWSLEDSFSYMFSLSLPLCPLPALFFFFSCSSVLCDDLERFTDFSSKTPFCPSQKAPCIGQSCNMYGCNIHTNQYMYINKCVFIGLAKKLAFFHKIE